MYAAMDGQQKLLNHDVAQLNANVGDAVMDGRTAALHGRLSPLNSNLTSYKVRKANHSNLDGLAAESLQRQCSLPADNSSVRSRSNRNQGLPQEGTTAQTNKEEQDVIDEGLLQSFASIKEDSNHIIHVDQQDHIGAIVPPIASE